MHLIAEYFFDSFVEESDSSLLEFDDFIVKMNSYDINNLEEIVFLNLKFLVLSS